MCIQPKWYARVLFLALTQRDHSCVIFAANNVFSGKLFRRSQMT